MTPCSPIRMPALEAWLLLCSCIVSAGTPVLHLGFCGSAHDFFWPAVAAVARKSVESSTPIIPLQGTTNFQVAWEMPFADEKTVEVEKGLELMMGSAGSALGFEPVTYPPMNAIVGCTTSSVSTKVASFGYFLGAVMVSYVSGADELSDKLSYPYFLRTRAGGAPHGAGIAKMFQHFGWMKCGYMYEDYNFHRGIFEAAVAEGHRVGVTILGVRLAYYVTRADFKRDIWKDQMAQTLGMGVKVFGLGVAYGNLKDAYQVGVELGTNSFLVILAQGFGGYQPLWPLALRMAWNGAMGIDAAQSGRNNISTGLDALWQNMTYSELRSLGWVPDAYIAKMEAADPAAFSKSVLTNYHAHEFDAIMAVLLSFQQLLDQGTPAAEVKGDVLRSTLLGLEFVGASGPMAFTPIVGGVGGDRRDPPLEIVQAQNGVCVSVMNVKDLVTVTAKVLFPDGSDNPRHYDPLIECLSNEYITQDAAGSDVCATCAAGRALSANGRDCEDCLPGFIAPIPGSTCFGCSSGTSAANAAQQDCNVCLAGTHAPSKNSTMCSPCGPGTYSDGPGSSVCSLCAMGRIASSAGVSECSVCPIGEFQAGLGSMSCRPCPSQSTTFFKAATDMTDCVCPEGMYKPLEAASRSLKWIDCLPCPPGMKCPFGSDMKNLRELSAGPYPVATLGHMTRSADPLKAFKCRLPEHCPGGPPGTCAAYRKSEAVACGECISGAYEDGSSCKACSDGVDLVPFVIVMILCFVGLILLALAVSRETIKQTGGMLTCTLLLGLTFTAMQTLGILDQLAFEWTEPVRTILQSLRVVSFDFKTLKFACVTETSVLSEFLARQLLAPLCVPTIIAVIVLKKRFVDLGTRLVPEAINATGTVFSILFISILVSCVSPLICYRHPDKTDSSMRSHVSTLCWKGGEHTSLVAIGMVSFILVPLPFMVLVAYGIFKYPKHVKSVAGKPFLLSFRFLLVKFKPDMYFYGSTLLLRSFLLTLVPVALQDAGAQIMMLCAFLLFFSLLQSSTKPWRSVIANGVDSFCSVLMVLLLISGSLSTQSGVETSEEVLSIVSILVMSSLILLVAGSLAFAMCVVLMSRRPKFSWFICHHKAAAAAQARLLKILLQQADRKDRVFIDSDDLKDLDELFNIVKSHVANFVTYLTGDTLRRPWCAGEVTTAFKASSAKVVAVTTPSFLEPKEDELNNLDKYIDQDGGCNLAQYSIHLEDVKWSFIKLLDAETPRVRVRTDSLSTLKFNFVVAEVSKRPLPKQTLQLPPLPNDSGLVAISADQGDDEAIASASILVSKLQECLNQRMEGGQGEPLCSLCDMDLSDLYALADFIANSQTIIVLLSVGTMASPQQLVAILEGGAIQVSWGSECAMSPIKSKPSAPDDKVRMVIPMTLPGFIFPGVHFYSAVLPGMLPMHNEEAQNCVRAFFKLIACPLSTHASDQLLDLQAADVVARVPKAARAKKLARASSADGPIIKELAMRTAVNASGSSRLTEVGVAAEDSDDEDMVFSV